MEQMNSTSMTRRRSSSCWLIFSCFLSSLCPLCLCGESLSAPPPGKPLTYDDNLLPVLRQTCLGCHNADKAKGGLNMSSFAKLMEGGSSGEVVKPGDPDGSRLFALASHKEEPKMPPNAPMIAKESVETIRLWVEQGARENAGSKAIAAKPTTNIGLTSVVKGKPAGPPPMPKVRLRLDPVVRARRPAAVTALAASPWAPLVAVAGQHQVLLYNTDTGSPVGVLPFEPGAVNVLRFSRNGKLLLAGGGRGGQSGKVVVWNVETGEKVIEVGQEADAILAADISADQTQIAVGGPGKVVRVYSTKDGSVLREIKKHTDWIYAVEYSPDGVLLATGDRNGGLFVWEAFTGREYFALRGHTAAVTAVSWRDDANVLSSCSEDGTARLWEMENGNPIKSWGAHGGGALSINYSHDGRIVTAGRDRLVKVWDGNGAVQKQLDPFADLALRAAFSHDGARVIAGDWTGQVRVWTTADGKLADALDSNPPTVAERVTQATAELTTAQAAFDKANAAHQAAQAAAAKAAADLAAAQKAVGDSAAAAKVAADAVGPAKAAVDQAAAAVAAAQATHMARDVTAKAYADAAGRIKEAAGKAPANKDLATAAQKAQELANQVNAELAAALKAVTDTTAAQKAAADKFAAVQKAAGDMATAAAEAPKRIAPLTAAVKPTADQAAAAKAAADLAAAALVKARAKVDALKSGQAVAAK
jgi:hypothetical protein